MDMSSKDRFVRDLLDQLMGGTFPTMAETAKTKAKPSEVDVYAEHDDLLRGLQKDYIEAQNKLTSLKKTFGKKAPMTEVASDMVDSAKTAVETRLIELRNNRYVKGKVLAHMKELREAEEYAMNSASRKYREMAQMLYNKMMNEKKTRHEKEKDSMMFAMFYFWITSGEGQFLSPDFRRSFSLASGSNGRGEEACA